MILVFVLPLACLVAAPSVPAAREAVRVNARPELPWIVVVAALGADVPGAALAQALSAATGALDDVGARAHIELLSGRAVIVVEGPPEAHDVVVNAARAAAIATREPRFVLFVDGRTSLADQGALPSPSSPSPSSPSSPAGAPTPSSLPLAPTPGLLDVEGEALALLVEGALSVDVDVQAAAGRASLVLERAPEGAGARAALEALVAAPLPARVVDALRTRAHGRLAERRARAGGWARDMAAMWLAFGTIDVDDPADLGSSLRARVFPDVLVR